MPTDNPNVGSGHPLLRRSVAACAAFFAMASIATIPVSAAGSLGPACGEKTIGSPTGVSVRVLFANNGWVQRYLVISGSDNPENANDTLKACRSRTRRSIRAAERSALIEKAVRAADCGHFDTRRFRVHCPASGGGCGSGGFRCGGFAAGFASLRGPEFRCRRNGCDFGFEYRRVARCSTDAGCGSRLAGAGDDCGSAAIRRDQTRPARADEAGKVGPDGIDRFLRTAARSVGLFEAVHQPVTPFC
jgi:hypothetical protein